MLAKTENQIPASVTVRQMGEPKPIRTQHNAVERAAMMDARDDAVALLSDLLGFEPNGKIAYLQISPAPRWRALSVPSRLMEIASWVKAEAYECMDLVECGQVSTIGD